LASLAAACALGACTHKDANGLPPGKDLHDVPGGEMMPAGGPAALGGGGEMGGNPHAGLGMSPHAAMGEGADEGEGGAADPHAGLDMNNPHGGGANVAAMALPSPDPNRPIDPTHHVRGVIKVDPKAKDRVKPGTAVFVVAKLADAAGKPAGPPVAVEKLTWPAGGETAGLAFELTEAQAMIAGTQLVGSVVVTAHYDQDGDAISKQPGDLLGAVAVKIPADAVTLTLDQILP
jgi:hypothetical protein